MADTYSLISMADGDIVAKVSKVIEGNVSKKSLLARKEVLLQAIAEIDSTIIELEKLK